MQIFQSIVSSSLLAFLVILSSPNLLTSPQPQPPSIACKSTPYPKLCRSILSAFKSSPSDPYNYGKFTIRKCLKQAKKLSKAINRYLNHKKYTQYSHLEAGAMQDCAQLADLNVFYLEAISDELKSADDSAIDEGLVDRVLSLLSGVVTNQHTCFDGLADAKSSFATVLGEPLENVTRLYSISLGLVTHASAWNVKRFKRSKGAQDKGSLKNGVRQPLESLVQALRTSHHCNNKLRDCQIRGQRRLGEEAESKGILINDAVIVGSYDGDNFSTIGEAIASAPGNTKPEDGYFVIYARQGYYYEYIIVPKEKKNIMLIGDGINKTIITGNHSRIDGWTTYNSSTFVVIGERFVAVDVTFKNTAGPKKHQAVAVRNSADFSTFYRCSFEGYQDTLYVHSLRQFYRECDIYGTVDFVFGDATAVFQSCNFYVRRPLPEQKNTITAQGRSDPNQNTGISIQNCTIEAAPDLASNLSSNLNYLGRPWKPYSRTVFMESYIGELISPSGWLEWNGTFGLETLYYGEFGNYGPGANTSTRVKWPGYSLLNATQAMGFTVYNFTMGNTWLHDADIPFSGGLYQ